MLILRPYQEQLINETRQALKQSKTVLMQAPTGAGKTAITVFMMSRAAESGKTSMFLVHQNELLYQTSKALWKQKLEHGIIASGKRVSKMASQVASVQTLVRRLDKYNPPDLIIIDECHRSSSETYQKILAAYPKAIVIGLTATPQRTDGKGLVDTYSVMVSGPSISQLIKAGFLCDYDIFAPPSMADVSEIKTKMGDYDKKQLEASIDKPTITGNAVTTYANTAKGKRCVVMCVSIKHAKHVTDSYNASGIKAETIEGIMTNKERETVLDRFRDGQTLVITAVQLLIEGLDIPSIEVIQWLRPTQSLIIWMQGNGRGLRPSDGKEKLLILDHVGNWKRHGLPDDDRDWTLEGKKKGKRKADDDEPDVHIHQCKACFHIFKAGVPACPSCGEPLEVRGKAPPEEIEGELEKIDMEAIKRERKHLQGKARDLADLVKVGYSRGMNKPAAWAANVFAARSGRKASKTDYDEANHALRALRAANEQRN